MSGLLSVLGLVGPLSLILSLLVIALLSQRLGMITKRVRHYRWLFVAVGLMLIAFATRIGSLNAPDGAVYSLLIAVALTIGAAVAWYYWSWLLHERQYVPDVTSENVTKSTPS